MVYLLDQKNYEGLIEQFEMHFHLFKNSFEQLNQASSQQANSFSLKIAHLKIEELRWRSNWHYILARMLEEKPLLFNQDNIYFKLNQTKKGQLPKVSFLSTTQVEQFSCGYHYFNCMLSLMKRKEELVNLINCYKAADN